MANLARGRNPYERPQLRAGEPPVPAGDVIWAGPRRFAVPAPPDSTDPEYTTAFASQLKAGGSSDGTMLPSDIRIGAREPVENNPNDREYNARRMSDFLRRHSVEEFETPWKVRQRKAAVPSNPYWTADVVSERPTADMSPSLGLFTRPWHVPRNRAEIEPGAVLHFSMAAHRRNYPIYGMQPRGRVGVNTYRAEPKPWDENLFRAPQAGNSAQSSLFGNRAHRAGGGQRG